MVQIHLGAPLKQVSGRIAQGLEWSDGHRTGPLINLILIWIINQEFISFKALKIIGII